VHDVSYEEAQALLKNPQRCEDAGDWQPEKQPRDVWSLSIGVLDQNGIRTQLLVDLIYRTSQKTGFTRYIFTVFLRHTWGVERVYQLDVMHSRRPIKDKHSQSHEHVGKRRIDGELSWQKWQIEDVLQHFSQQTKIEFLPPVRHPEVFELKG
jgi:hypothetical protein